MKVEEFIHRRFSSDCSWLTGNCYYFAVILKARFPEAIIFYDIINGHFITQINNQYYDWTGKIQSDINNQCIEWDKFEEYDSLQNERIINNCIL